MAASAPPAPGPVELKVRSLVLDVFDPTDLQAAAPTDRLKARMAGFILLAHAEIEAAIENACYSVSALVSGASDPATAMLAWGFQQVKIEEAGKSAGKKRTPLAALVVAYDAKVATNNGIKQSNLKTLLMPLGVDLAPLNTDMAALDAFGTRRGGLAHQPLSAWATSDLPSATVANGVQAGRSADIVVAAIIAKHSAVTPRTAPTPLALRGAMARQLRRLADVIEA